MTDNRRYPNESQAYRDARDELLQAEVALRAQTERVAELRRALPDGGVVPQDYVFEGQAGPVSLAELFGDHDTLVLYSYMYGPNAKQPCPLCTAFLDSLDGSAPHLQQQIALAVAVRSPLARVRSLADARGWRNLRLLSAQGNDYARDYHTEAESGGQLPLINVFKRARDGVRHFWASEMLWASSPDGMDARHIDAMWPLWNVLDVTPGGRGSFYPKNQY